MNISCHVSQQIVKDFFPKYIFFLEKKAKNKIILFSWPNSHEENCLPVSTVAWHSVFVFPS